ncbi:GDSL-type esterase/lipase family protein [Geitlerinema sp. PCC 9228]|uniref:GDSL-type esterase/lipase family protein n=1 Tax=Geitlerinema sp. PCC 9228 TaxID=111611 RepID=UPI0008F9DF5A|nr:GDSL-type esterase/lipase family protein [Geitlerinema sp. PCC 9228]
MSNPVKHFSVWTWLLLAVNGLAVAGLGMVFWPHKSAQPPKPPTANVFGGNAPGNAVSLHVAPTPEEPSPALGVRHHLSYQEWLKILEKEANAIAAQSPAHLSILLGDSITLWFPHEWLPANSIWLNQGISGDTSAGVLKRLDLFRPTHPDRIFIMIGINDLLRGMEDEVLLENYRQILRRLQEEHPEAYIVVQSILPHAGEAATWEGRDRFAYVSNTRIRTLNTRLRAIAGEMGTYYLDLYPLFVDEEGKLNPKLSTDGLHLNERGYLVWRSAMQMYAQMVLPPLE